MRKSFPVKGMHCASCAANIERRLGKLDGVKFANVNYANNTATVEYDEKKVGAGEFSKAIEKLGYSIINTETDRSRQDSLRQADYEQNEILELKKRVIYSAILTIPVLVLAVPEMLAGFVTLKIGRAHV